MAREKELCGSQEGKNGAKRVGWVGRKESVRWVMEKGERKGDRRAVQLGMRSQAFGSYPS